MQGHFNDADIREVASQVPTVLLNSYADEDYICDSVVVDNYSLMRTAVRHLVERGHRRIGFWGMRLKESLRSARSFAERLEAFRSIAIEFDLDFDESCISAPIAYERTLHEVRHAFKSQLKDSLSSSNPPGAYVAAEYTYAMEMLNAAKELRLQIPKSFAVISCSYDSVCEYSIPSISAMDYDRTEMGRLAMETLLRRVDRPLASFVKTLSPALLTIREST